MSKIGVFSLSLGYTRLAGLTIYDTRTRDFTETKPKAARQLIEQGRLYGVLWDKDRGQFVPDPKFNRNDILVKSGVGNYRWLLHEVPGEAATSDYIVVRMLRTNRGNIYELINNKCQRVKLTETQLRELSALGNIGGVFLTDDNIEVCEGVLIQDRTYPDEPGTIIDDDFGKIISEDAGSDSESEEGTEQSAESTEQSAESTTATTADTEANAANTDVGLEHNEPTLSEIFGEGANMKEGKVGGPLKRVNRKGASNKKKKTEA